MRAPIHSVKHYVQMSRFSVTTVTVTSQDLLVVIPQTGATLGAVDEVREGAIVKAIYIELWLLDAGNDGSFVVTLTKASLDSNGPTFTESNALGNYNEKKNVLYVTQGLTSNDGITGPINVMRGWFKIPKSKQRFGIGDGLKLVIANNGGQALFGCGFATFKEYT